MASKKYHKEHARKYREADRKISDLYHAIEPGEPYTVFRRRIKRDLRY